MKLLFIFLATLTASSSLQAKNFVCNQRNYIKAISGPESKAKHKIQAILDEKANEWFAENYIDVKTFESIFTPIIFGKGRGNTLTYAKSYVDNEEDGKFFSDSSFYRVEFFKALKIKKGILEGTPSIHTCSDLVVGNIWEMRILGDRAEVLDTRMVYVDLKKEIMTLKYTLE